MKRILISVFLICIGSAEIVHAGSNLLTLTEAESLARSAAAPTGVTKLEGFTLEPGNVNGFPNFYFFTAYVAVRGAQGSSGNYAVDKFTGEVWNPYGCSRFSNPRLVELQRELRKKVGLTPQKYQQHKRDNPCLV
jgi:hypothetical protein